MANDHLIVEDTINDFIASDSDHKNDLIFQQSA